MKHKHQFVCGYCDTCTDDPSEHECNAFVPAYTLDTRPRLTGNGPQARIIAATLEALRPNLMAIFNQPSPALELAMRRRRR